MIALPLGMVAILAALMALTGQGADSVLRHLYLVPTIWVALGRGTVGGGLVGSLAGLLHAPIVLPAVERHGITSQTSTGSSRSACRRSPGCSSAIWPMAPAPARHV